MNRLKEKVVLNTQTNVKTKYYENMHTFTLKMFLPFQGGTSLVDPFCSLCFFSVMLSSPFIAALWSPAGMFSCVFVTFPYGVLGQVWYLIVSILDLCLLPCITYIEPFSKFIRHVERQIRACDTPSQAF